jgi:hypothetical protein
VFPVVVTLSFGNYHQIADLHESKESYNVPGVYSGFRFRTATMKNCCSKYMKVTAYLLAYPNIRIQDCEFVGLQRQAVQKEFSAAIFEAATTDKFV